ncbi:MAG: aminodeoxychorismate/anthranilate synthase component II [Deltaproteobacteria bacterium]|nr:aminodeoxychorismate/anthranilate synthase component II [Deltaproteobacteria bacterium]MCK5709055.1 aminodeoxychorismate/anthranilate synthase component II [Deltaproteobacteria bacterium]
MILMIDNYDSFTYNLVHYLAELGEEVVVHRNDKLELEDIGKLNPDMLVVSPGPCTPKEAGISVEAIKEFAARIPILGVCLGHQSLAYAYGAEIVRAQRLLHGKTSEIHHDKKGIYKGIPDPFEATRYHSLLVNRESLPEELEITAWTDEGEIMGIRHKEHMMEGVQFHPESILTKHGKDLLRNFISIAKKKSRK